MRRSLISNGYTNVDGKNIGDLWNQFRKEKTNEYIKAKEQIRQDTRMVADVSKQSRLTTV